MKIAITLSGICLMFMNGLAVENQQSTQGFVPDDPGANEMTASGSARHKGADAHCLALASRQSTYTTFPNKHTSGTMKPDTGMKVAVAAAPVAPNISDTTHGKNWLTSFDGFQEGEAVTLYFASMGCFSQVGRKIIFTKTSSGVRAALYESTAALGGADGNSFPEKVIASKNLTQADYNTLKDFEHQLMQERPGGCTTIDRYTLKDEYGMMTINDTSCAWSGFNQLVPDLFGSIKWE